MVTRHAPLADAAMEIKLNATLGHLWFEEIVSGDRHEDIEELWSYLNQADWYTRVMLIGGKNEEGNFYSLTDEHMRSTIESVRVALSSASTLEMAVETLHEQSALIMIQATKDELNGCQRDS